MTRKRRFKVQLGFAAFVIIIVIYGWSEYDLSDKMTRNAVSRTKEISDGSFTRRTLLAYSTLENKTCTRPSIAEFPGDLFNQSQRKHGAVVFHFFVAFYLSWAIAIVSDDYFVPVMEIICEKLKLQSDVAGATFMAFGSSAPELFASIIGVFITQGDIGVGTILGSAVFNVLFVIGACGVGAGTVLYLSWWPFVRDNMFYFFSLVILILVLMDGIVTWPEALAMVLSFSFYLLIMFFNPRIEAWLYRITNTSNPEFKSDLDALNRNENSKTINTTFSYEKMVDEKNDRIQEKEKKSDGTENNRHAEKETDEDKADGKEREEKNDKQKEETQPLNGSGSHVSRHYDSIPQQQPDPDFAPKTPFSPPKGLLSRLSWLFALPIKVAFYLTIPDVKKESCQKWVAVSFVICILWVAVASYALVWMVTVIGYTFGLSDAIMGLTLVAFGSSVSDCAASVFIARKGDGNMAVSNTIGSNTFDILLCLGVPWLVKSLWNHQSPIVIHSHGLFLSCFCILGSVVIAFLVLFFTKWVLNRKVGCIFLMAYFIFLGSSIYMELRHSDLLPTCAIKV